MTGARTTQPKKEKSISSYCKKGRMYWRVNVRLPMPDGTHKPKQVSDIPSLDLAKKVRDKLMADAFEGRFFDRPKVRSLTVAGAWKTYAPVSELEKESWQTDEGRAKHLVRHLGDKRCETLTQRDVDQYRTSRLEEKTVRGGPPAVGTLNREVALLKRLMTYAIKCGDLDRNPLQGVGLLRENNTRDVVASEQQFAALVAAADAVFKPILLVAYDTGMRLDEVLGLEWRQVDLKEGVIRLQAEDTKTAMPRDILLTARAKAEVEALPRSLSGFVFVNPKTGDRWVDVRKQFRKACKDAGISGLWFHDLRRSFITNTRRRGGAESVVMKMSGHRTREVFTRYNIIDNTDLRAALALIEAGIAAELSESTEAPVQEAR
ncbi:MAG: site-specific integrase [Proteobacteria bacterium]|jgi:integrase|nr:site-specific integrase [Pseudomonadota bacterium]